MTATDLSDTIVPKSDQMNADDLVSGPRTFTITEVRKTGSGTDDQPVSIYLEEFPRSRPFKPSKSMRRVMVVAWGPDAAAYVGRRLTLYRDPEIMFGKDKVGGIRISHLSHIRGRLEIALTKTRGKREPYFVDRLADDAPPPPRTASPDLLAELVATFDRKGIPADARLAGVNSITGGSATDLEVITEDEARQVLEVLAGRPDADGGQA